MTENRDLKLLVRKRMEKTGESYATARRHLEGTSSTAQQRAGTTDTTTPPSRGVDSRGAYPAGTVRTSPPIQGWYALGPTPDDYDIRPDATACHGTAASVLIRSLTDTAVRSSTKLMQHFLAQEYRGQRVRWSGWIKSEAVTSSCRLLMRLDENTRLLMFTYSAPVTGTSDWTRREVVLDVDPEATLISIGFELDGAGSAWLADVGVDSVGTDVPTTASRQIPTQPRNLSFSE